MAKVFTFSRKVFFIFNIFPSFDLSTTCVVVITWFCGYFLRRQFWLLLFVWYTISSTCSRSIYFLYSFRYHIDNVIRILSAVLFCSLEWKKCDLESNRSAFNLPEKRMKKRGKIKKFGYTLFSFPGMFLIKCLILLLLLFIFVSCMFMFFFRPRQLL